MKEKLSFMVLNYLHLLCLSTLYSQFSKCCVRNKCNCWLCICNHRPVFCTFISYNNFLLQHIACLLQCHNWLCWHILDEFQIDNKLTFVKLTGFFEKNLHEKRFFHFKTVFCKGTNNFFDQKPKQFQAEID